MPKNKVDDLITDQEIAFARLVLSGTMTDREAAQASGLHPAAAAYTKAKPRVRAWMVEHRAAAQQQVVEQETEERRRLNISREQVLTRLWEIVNLSSEKTRGSMTSQVKALSMIVAMESFIPDRRAGASQKHSRTAAHTPAILCRRLARPSKQEAAALQTDPALAHEEPQQEQPGPAEPKTTPPVIAYEPGESAFVNRVSPSETTPSPFPPAVFDFSPDPRAFSLLVHPEQPSPTRIFLKKSRTSPDLPVPSRSENAVECLSL